MDQHLLQRELRERVIEALRVDPPAMPLRPARLAVAIDPAVTQQLLEHPVPGGRARAADVVAAAQYVPAAPRFRASAAEPGAAAPRDAGRPASLRHGDQS